MRIAAWHDLPSGGGKRALYDHVSGLVNRGHEVRSWCTPMADQLFLPLSEVVPERVVPMRAPRLKALGNVADKLTRGATTTYGTLKAIEEHTQRCAEEIRRFRPDVVLAASSFAVGASPLARYLDLPSVLYLQEPKRHLYEAAPRLPWPALPRQRPGLWPALVRMRDMAYVRANRVLAREELDNVKAYDRVLVNSYFSRESVLRAYGTEARVCYLGVDVKRFQSRGEPRENLVVGIGEFSQHKRAHVAIQAVSELPAPRPVLAWVGNTANKLYFQEVLAEAERLAIEFRPLVSIPHAEVVDVLNRASALVYAPRLEPFGYAPIEAAACGLPVVALAEGGVRESVIHGETGLLVDDDAALAPALARVLADKALGERMGAAGRLNVEAHWSLEAATDRLEQHLTKVVSLR